MSGFKGVDIIKGNTRPECFLRGLKFSDNKIRGLNFFLEDSDANI